MPGAEQVCDYQVVDFDIDDWDSVIHEHLMLYPDTMYLKELPKSSFARVIQTVVAYDLWGRELFWVRELTDGIECIHLAEENTIYA